MSTEIGKRWDNCHYSLDIFGPDIPDIAGCGNETVINHNKGKINKRMWRTPVVNLRINHNNNPCENCDHFKPKK